MSKTKIEQYPNSLMTISRLIAERNFKNVPPLEKAMQINKIERENFYKDKEKSKDDVDEFVNKLVKIDGYITELTLYFDNSERLIEVVQEDRFHNENPQVYENVEEIQSLPDKISTDRTVGSGIRKKKKGRPKLRGGAWEDEYRDDGMTHGAYLELVKVGVAPKEGIILEPLDYKNSKKSNLLQRFENRSKSRSSDRVDVLTRPRYKRPPVPKPKTPKAPISASSSISSRESLSESQKRINEETMRRALLARDVEQRARNEVTEDADPIIGRDIFGRVYYESDRPYLNDDEISSLSTNDYDRISNQNIGKDDKQITFILVLLTKILEEINAINLFYKSKIFKNYKKISVFDIELINKELIDLYNKWNELLQLIQTYPFLNVKALTNKVNTQFSKLYGLTKQINPSLNINDTSKQQFELSIADDLAKSQNIRRENIRARRQEVEDELSDQANWAQRSNDSIY